MHYPSLWSTLISKKKLVLFYLASSRVLAVALLVFSNALYAADFVDTAAINQATLAPGWSGQAFTFNGDVWIRSYFNGVGQFDYRIGAGGAIAEMRNVQRNYMPVLAPSAAGEVTDRVIQSTWWDDSITVPISAGSADQRFNLTQAGTGDNWITPTVSVSVTNSPVPQVDVYSTPQEQWQSVNRQFIGGKASYLTRYRLIGEGHLMIRRVMLIGDAYYNGTKKPFSSLYVEAWCPFPIVDSDPGFTNLALALNADGSPGWWYRTGYNIPNYGAFPVATTSGYAVVYRQNNTLSSTAVGVVYGNQNPQSWQQNVPTPYGSYVLNSRDFTTVLGVLPGLTFPAPASGSIIDQYLVLVPKAGLDSTMYNNLVQMVSMLPAPRFYPVNSVFEGELASIVTALKTNWTASAGARTDHLVTLITQ